MKVFELVDDIRNRLADTKEPQLWTDDELLVYLNDIAGILIKEIPTVYSEYSVTTQANIYTYPLPNDFISPATVLMDNTYLRFIPYNFIISRYTNSQTGVPQWYSYFKNNLYLFPIPDDVYNIKIIYRGYIMVSPMKFSDDLPTDTAIIAVMKTGILWQAYTKQDTETYDPTLADRFRNDFFQLLSFIKSKYVRDYVITENSYVHDGLL